MENKDKQEIVSPNNGRGSRVDNTEKVVIVGGSGFGKTTLAIELGKKHGYLVIEADKLRFLALKEDPEVAMQIFGDVPKNNETGMQFAYRMYAAKTQQGVEALAIADYKLFSLTRPHVDRYVSEISTCQATGRAIPEKFNTAFLLKPEAESGLILPNEGQGTAKKGLVVEGIFTNGSKQLGRETDAIAYIKVDRETRDRKLAKRLVEHEGFPSEAVGVIIPARNIAYDRLSGEVQHKKGLRLKNDYDNISKQDNADSIDYLLGKLAALRAQDTRTQDDRQQ